VKEGHCNQLNALQENIELCSEVNQLILALIAMEGIIVQILALLYLLHVEMVLIALKADQMKHGARLVIIAHLRLKFK
jgi:hypothetical protein